MLKQEGRYISWGILFLSTILALSITLILALLLALILIFFHVENVVLGGLLMLITYLAIFSGGVYAGRIVGSKGWLNGGLLGFLYMMILLILGRILIPMELTSMLFLRLLTGVLCGGLGGVLGVNTGE